MRYAKDYDEANGGGFGIFDFIPKKLVEEVF